MLSLIKLSGVRDDEVTKDVWKALFDKGMAAPTVVMAVLILFVQPST